MTNGFKWSQINAVEQQLSPSTWRSTVARAGACLRRTPDRPLCHRRRAWGYRTRLRGFHRRPHRPRPRGRRRRRGWWRSRGAPQARRVDSSRRFTTREPGLQRQDQDQLVAQERRRLRARARRCRLWLQRQGRRPRHTSTSPVRSECAGLAGIQLLPRYQPTLWYH